MPTDTKILRAISLIIGPNRGFSGGSVVKNPPVSAENMGLIPGSERSPGEGNGNPLQFYCLGKFHGQRSLTGHSPWGHKRVRYDLRD